jgi:2-keto-4-pentenoate hydratase/2-oxohepta-3-ene-1,7-dioic acid hydratase in catechol pathway
MRLIRFGAAGGEAPGVLTADGIRLDVRAFGEDWDEAFFGSDGPARLRAWLAEHAGSCPTVDADARLGPCVARPSKIICIGLNYAGHARETGAAIPAEPVVFFKATTALCGPDDDLLIPPGATKVDWEVELAVVVGRRARYVSERNAMDCVAGYALHNDYSERAWQLERGGQWVKGKSCDTFAPLGPQLVTPDEIDDVHDLRMWLSVNGTTVQDSSTAKMVFKVPQLLSYISRFMTLLPGDVVCTGTPAGVGLGMVPPQYLKAGDVVELGIDKIGVMRQTVVAANT